MIQALQQQIDNILAIKCYRRFYDFFIAFWQVLEPTMPLKENWHIQYLCDEAQVVIENRVAGNTKMYDLIVSISPGETKSTIFSRMLPAWAWLRDPSLKILTGSYDFILAQSFTTASRDIILSAQYQTVQASLLRLKESAAYAEELKHYKHFKLKTDQNLKSYYQSDCGGLRRAASPGGGITGFHFDVIIVDDSVKAPMPRQGVGLNYTDITTAIHWVTRVLTTRKTDREKTVSLYIQQRVAKKDVTDALLRTISRVKHIRLPATNKHPIEPPELQDNYRNGYMNPYTTNEEVIKQKIAEMTPSGWLAQFEQNPDDEGGGIWKSEWFGRYKPEELPDNVTWHTITDTASTDDTSNSSTGMLCYAYHNGTYYIRAFKALWVQADKLGYEYVKFHVQNGYDPVASRAEIEPKANGISFIQLMRNESIVGLATKELIAEGIHTPLKRINTKPFDNVLIGSATGADKKSGQVRYMSMSKTDKALHVANTIRSGRVKLLDESHLPTYESWREFLDAAEDFPNTGITEVIDTVAYMIVSNETVSAGALLPPVVSMPTQTLYRRDMPIHLFWHVEASTGKYNCTAAQFVLQQQGEAVIVVHDEVSASNMLLAAESILDIYANHQGAAIHYHIKQPSAEYTALAEQFSPRGAAYQRFGCRFSSIFDFTGKTTALNTIASGGKQKTIEQIAARSSALSVLISGGYRLKTTQFAGSTIQLIIDNNLLDLADALKRLLKDYDNIERYGDRVNCLSLGVSKVLNTERELYKL